MGRGYEGGIPGAAPTDPILAGGKLAGLLGASPAGGQKDLVDLPDQSEAQGEAFLEAEEAMVHGGHIARNLSHIIEGNAGCAGVLIGQQI